MPTWSATIPNSLASSVTHTRFLRRQGAELDLLPPNSGFLPGLTPRHVTIAYFLGDN
jgi:hypothetical protein